MSSMGRSFARVVTFQKLRNVIWLAKQGKQAQEELRRRKDGAKITGKTVLSNTCCDEPGCNYGCVYVTEDMWAT
jgi:hypothetical protein